MSGTALAAVASLLSALSLVGAVALLRMGAARQARLRLDALVQGALGAGTQAEDGPGSATRLPGRPGSRLLAWLGRSQSLPPEALIALPLVVLGGVAAGLLAGIAVAWAVGPAPAGVVGAVVAGMSMSGLFRYERERYRDQLFAQLPDAIQLVVRALRAGLPINEALRTVARDGPAPTRGEFERALAQLAIGQSMDQALATLAERTTLPEYNFLAITVGLQMQTGGNLAETLDNLAEMTRQRVALRGRIRAVTAEARTSAKVLVALPFVIATLSAMLTPQNLRILVGDPFGRQLLMGGIALLIFGVLTIRRMLRSASAE